MTKRQSPGFSVIEAVVILVVVLAAGLGGWYVWHKNKSEPAKKSSNTTQNTNSSQAAQQTDPSEGGKYLVIKEWGVRFLLPDELKGDISYFVNDKAEKDFGGPVLIDLLSKKFSAGSLKCAVVEGDTPRSLVSIGKTEQGHGLAESEGNSGFSLGAPTACEEAINREGSAADKRLLTLLKDAINSNLETVPKN